MVESSHSSVQVSTGYFYCIFSVENSISSALTTDRLVNDNHNLKTASPLSF
jgi:hypothetical protein